jgi:hypothetical protein
MTIFNKTELQQECEPDRWSARVPLVLQFLLGRIPLRRLSQSLIIILMLISPLSFSTDKLTNFTYECPVASGCSIKDTRRSAVIYRTSDHLQQTHYLPAADHDLPAAQPPPLLHLGCTFHSRAPPA